MCAPYTSAYESIAVCAPYTYAYESGMFEIRGGEGGEEGCRATDGNTANPYIRVCVCVCVRACVRVMIIVQNFVLFTNSVISLQ